ncbi:hypothetical protein FNV43_RR14481 [Rhamnella rubrinervis]|uniref:60S ribosomal protein L34 n=1 Tax=Rhamnella rubrinervis TaxID=2594499 RepID=A0A8K0MGG6_9ROSA|nr:hypothetical protein FNV43_RR14481 [Rhamnella rubrinervis]
MGAPEKFVLYTQFDFVNMVSVNGFFHSRMALFSCSFWVSFSFFLTLFKVLYKVFFRYIYDDGSKLKNSSCSNILSRESNQIDSSPIESEGPPKEPSSEIFSTEASENNGFNGKEKSSSDFVFKFQFPTYEEFSKSHKRNEDFGILGTASPTSNGECGFLSVNKFSHLNDEPEVTVCGNKYEFVSGQSVSCFMEEAKVGSFSVEELFSDPNCGCSSEKEVAHYGFLSEKDFVKESAEVEAVCEIAPSNSADRECREEEAEKLMLTEDSYAGKDQLERGENDFPGKQDVCDGKDKFLTERNFTESDSDSDSSITSSREFSVIGQFVGSTSDGFLSDTDFEGINELRTALRKFGGRKLETETEDLEDFDLDETDLQDLSTEKPEDFDEEDEDIMEEVRKLEESESGRDKAEELVGREEKAVDGSDNCGKSNEQTLSASDSEDPNSLETLWEHQELIEQLKMELKKVRATGLPTILEESECPKMMEDLKPWKIDEKFQHGDRLSELHKFYKSYRERMRKLDILNYQKMYAIGVLQSKDPLHSFSSAKSSSPPPIISLLSQSLWRCKRKTGESDPMMKFIRELHGDLEMVYVGQLCLSWEFLQWQYEKAFELWESEPYGLRKYNEVAGEFQQFQVLMQRFIENEPFQGPRVENYVKNRCVMRNLLQVPVIREDNSKVKRRARKVGRDNGAITGDMLLEILEESIRTIWLFIRADKRAHTTVLKCRRGTDQTELQDPADSKLLMELQTELQKKEKKLKEVLRAGNCILKRFKKHNNNQEDGTEHLYFFSQVDMKLVTRVLNMSRITTDQLVWCHSKLSKINFVNRKSRASQHSTSYLSSFFLPPVLFCSGPHLRNTNSESQTELDNHSEMVQRLTYRKRHSYATKSNQHRVVKTPGGKLIYQSTKKRASGPKCPVTGKRIQGIPHLRPAEYKRSRLSRNRRTVNRAYGGVLSGGAVRERIIRAFLVEEQKIVKKVLKIQKAKEKQATKS